MAVAETRNAPATTETTTEKGTSFARGPALVLGTILLAAGLYSLYKQHTYPPLSNFPNGTAPIGGKVFGIFGANGWTGMLTAIAGGLLLFGAAEHLLAKTMSLIVGVGLGAAAVIALISGDVLGLAAANHMTELAWGIAAAILLVNTLAPRRRRRVTTATDDEIVDRRTTRLAPRRRQTSERVTPVDEETRVMPEREPVTERVAPADEETRAMPEREPVTERVAPADEETHVMHDHERAPFSPDDQETRVMAGRDATVEPGTDQRP